ncbi:MAG TPA: hypothetical protein ENN13_05255 [Candidatus Altiarchaeales archaeon]|nr:hypothetical protein [Candidatus Altiarchaeales archaeon]
MKRSLKTGVAFGLTSGAITTLGLMVGLNSGTHSRLVVLGGILTIAIADACSDALGIHISEESGNVHTPKEIWASTLSTFFSKFLFALTFAVPVILLPLQTAVYVSIAWGLSVLAVLSYFISKEDGNNTAGVIFEHLTIAVFVILVTNYLGGLINTVFS